MDLVRLIFRPWARRVARRVLSGRNRAQGTPARGRFTHGDVDRLLEAAWVSYGERVPALPREPTAGSTMNVRLACFTLAFLDALLAEKVERGYAIELVADAAWGIYSVWGRIASSGRLQPAKGSALGFATIGKDGDPNAVSLRFPFNAPGYLIKAVASASGTAFDVVRCPVARYFRAHDAADLCVAAWCNLDYPLGEFTHQKLVRRLTLVQGDDHCDFRVYPADAAARSVADATPGSSRPSGTDIIA
jgi:hypothetical protein